MYIRKNISYDFKQTLISSGKNLLPNQCFQNCLLGMNQDNSKMFSLGFIVLPGTTTTAMHGWLEDKNAIYELTQSLSSNVAYYKVFSISNKQLQRYLPLKSLDCLIDHRHFMYSYCRVHNEIINAGYYMTYAGKMIPCKLNPLVKIKAIVGHIERKLLYNFLYEYLNKKRQQN